MSVLMVDNELTAQRPGAARAGIQSHVRYFRARWLVKREDRHSVENLESIRQDHVNFSRAICNHSVDGNDALDRGMTCSTMVIDWTARDTHIAWGNPCENPYHTYYLVV